MAFAVELEDPPPAVASSESSWLGLTYQEHEQHQTCYSYSVVPSNTAQHSSVTAEQLESLQLQHRQYKEYIQQFCAAAAGSAPHGDGSLSSADQISSLITSLYNTASVRTYIAALKAAAEAVRELERRLRDVELVEFALTSLDQFVAAVYAVIEALGSSIYAEQTAAYYAAGAVHVAPQLEKAGAVLQQRIAECRTSLHNRLSKEASSLLRACHWPPALVQQQQQQQPAGSSETSADAAAGGAEAPGGSGSSSSTNFAGFEADGGRLQQLTALLSCMTHMQMAVEREAFYQLLTPQAAPQQQLDGAAGGTAEGGEAAPAATDAAAHQQEGPLLWAMALLAAPLQERLSVHFGPSTEAGRLDKPEWMFKTIIRIVKEHIAYMDALQPFIAATGLSQHYHAGIEFARAMREATKAVLRAVRLPAVAAVGSAEVWMQLVDASADFERQLAPFLGAVSVGQDGELPDALAAASSLGALSESTDYFAAWMGAEQGSAAARLERILYDEDAWQASTQGMDEDDLEGPSSSGAARARFPADATSGAKASSSAAASNGWQREFNPPRMAQQALEVLEEVVGRSRHIPTPDKQREFLDTVGSSLLAQVHTRLQRVLEQAATFDNILSEVWAPKVAGCVTAARFLHHSLSELLESPALSRIHAETLRQQQAAAAAESSGIITTATVTTTSTTTTTTSTAAGATATASTTRSSVYTAAAMSVMEASPSKGGYGLGEVVVRHSFAPLAVQPPVLAGHVAELGSMHREWCLRIARELAFGFGKAAVGYRSGIEQAGQYPTHEGAAGTVTPALLPALTYLQTGLHHLAGPMDGPSFRDIWRAVAVPVNRFLFNYVATEARFSPAGAQQFAVDTAGVVAVFAPYTGRPAAHFRETLAAVRLLTLPDEYAGEVVRRASHQSALGLPLSKDPWLSELGVAWLLPGQVLAVVDRRL